MVKKSCAINLKKGEQRASMSECLDRKQVKYYGVEKVDKKTLDDLTSSKMSKAQRNKLVLQMQKLKRKILKGKEEYKKMEAGDKKKKKLEELKKIDKLRIDVVKMLKKFDEKKDKKEKQNKGVDLEDKMSKRLNEMRKQQLQSKEKAKTTQKRVNPWLEHVKMVKEQKENKEMAYKDVLKKAKQTYKSEPKNEKVNEDKSISKELKNFLDSLTFYKNKKINYDLFIKYNVFGPGEGIARGKDPFLYIKDRNREVKDTEKFLFDKINYYENNKDLLNKLDDNKKYNDRGNLYSKKDFTDMYNTQLKLFKKTYEELKNCSSPLDISRFDTLKSILKLPDKKITKNNKKKIKQIQYELNVLYNMITIKAKECKNNGFYNDAIKLYKKIYYTDKYKKGGYKNIWDVLEHKKNLVEDKSEPKAKAKAKEIENWFYGTIDALIILDKRPNPSQQRALNSYQKQYKSITGKDLPSITERKKEMKKQEKEEAKQEKKKEKQEKKKEKDDVLNYDLSKTKRKKIIPTTVQEDIKKIIIPNNLNDLLKLNLNNIHFTNKCKVRKKFYELFQNINYKKFLKIDLYYIYEWINLGATPPNTKKGLIERFENDIKRFNTAIKNNKLNTFLRECEDSEQQKRTIIIDVWRCGKSKDKSYGVDEYEKMSNFYKYSSDNNKFNEVVFEGKPTLNQILENLNLSKNDIIDTVEIKEENYKQNYYSCSFLYEEKAEKGLYKKGIDYTKNITFKIPKTKPKEEPKAKATAQ